MSNQFAQAVNMVDDFSDFVQAGDWMWYSNHLSQADVNQLPFGEEFWALYAPVLNYNKWTLKLFQVKKLAEIEAIRKQTGRVWYRGYVALKTVELEQAPFEWSETVDSYELPQGEMKQVA